MSSVRKPKVHKLTTSLEPFHGAVRDWFTASFPAPTKAQSLGWPAIARGDWTLIFAPTGSGKTLTAFLWALDRLMFTAGERGAASGERVGEDGGRGAASGERVGEDGGRGAGSGERVGEEGERVTASGKRAAAGKAKGGRAK